MSDYPMRLPITFSYKRNKLEENIINLSNKIFNKIIIGIIFSLSSNALYIYLYYYKRQYFYMFICTYASLFVLMTNILFGKK